MTNFRDARRIFQERLNAYAEKREISYGVLGDGRGQATSNIIVPNSTDYVWARRALGDKTYFPIINRSAVVNSFDLPVVIGYTDTDPDNLQVLGVHYAGLGGGASIPVSGLGPHHEQHEAGGGDDVFVEGTRFKPGLLGPTDPISMQLVVQPFFFFWNEWRHFPGLTTDTLSGFLPPTGYNRYVLVAFDAETESLVYRPGFVFLPLDTAFERVPAPSGNEYPLGYAVLSSTTTELGWAAIDNTLGDARLHVGFPARQILDRLDQLEGYTGNNPNLATTGAAQWGADEFGGGGTNVGAFTDLSDVPSTYAGASGLVVTVNAASTGLTFASGVDIGSNAASVQAVNFLEQGSALPSPDTSHRLLFAMSDGLYEKNAAGTLVGPFGTRLSLTSTGPSDIAGASVLGVATSAAKGDHVHRGVQSVNVPGNAKLFGDAYIQSGTGTTVTQSGNSILISASGGGGVAVSSIMVAGASPLQANVFLVPGAGASLSQSGASITIATTGTANAVSSIGVNGAGPLQGVITLVQGTGASLSQSGGSITIGATATGGAAKIFGGRLSYDGDTPLASTDNLAASVLYYLPYRSDQVSLYSNASAWSNTTFTAPSLALAGLSPNSTYDVFGFLNGAELTLETARWKTDNITRLTAVSYQDGIRVSSTNKTRVLLGSLYIDATSGQSADSLAKRYLSNYYNREPRVTGVGESASSWTYSTNAWRSLNNSASNRVSAVFSDNLTIDLTAYVFAIQLNVGSTARLGIGKDTTTANCGIPGALAGGTSGAGVNGMLTAKLIEIAPLGQHFYQAVESVSGAASLIGANTPNQAAAGITGIIQG